MLTDRISAAAREMHWGFLISAALLAQSANAQEIDAKADEVLRAMSDHMAGITAFRLTAEASTEVLLRDGRKIQLTADNEALVDREKGALLRRHGPAGTTVVAYDGDSLTISNSAAAVYGSLPAPGGLDSALDEIRMVLGDEAIGGSDLLHASPYEGLMLEVSEGEYLGIARVGGQLTHHLSYRAEEVDWQLWVAAENDPLPVRYVITSKWMTAAPQFTVQFRSFETIEATTEEDFAFTPDKSYEELTPEELATRNLLIEE